MPFPIPRKRRGSPKQQTGEDKGYDVIASRSQKTRMERKDTAQNAVGNTREENAAIAYSQCPIALIE